jgi:hypothetical protein
MEKTSVVTMENDGMWECLGGRWVGGLGMKFCTWTVSVLVFRM